MAQGKGQKLTKHHVLPTSRGGEDDGNIVKWDRSFHSLYHQMFENMTLEEIRLFLRIVSQPGTSWSRQRISMLKKRIIRGDIVEFEVKRKCKRTALG